MAGTIPNNDTLGWSWVRKNIANMQQFVDMALAPIRQGIYGETVLHQLTEKQFKYADEGSYYITRSPTFGTGLITTAALSTLDDTKPWLVIQNANPSDSSGGMSRNIILDYIKLTYTVLGTNAAGLQWCTKKDFTTRYSSGGSGGTNTGMASNILLGPHSTNTDVRTASGALIWASSTGANLAVTTASPRLMVLGNGTLATTQAQVVGSTNLWNFSGRDPMLDTMAISTNQVENHTIYHQPVVLGPGHTFLMMLALSGQTAASNFEIEIGHIER